jgi:hypothetical protein
MVEKKIESDAKQFHINPGSRYEVILHLKVFANFPTPSTIQYISSCTCIRNLLSSMEERLFTAEELLRYTLHSALLKNKTCNFITEVLWEEALAQALFLDQTLQRFGVFSYFQDRQTSW